MNNSETMKQVYLLAQEHCGLKVGDWVRVDRYANWNEWYGSWLSAMNKMIGKVYRIDDINQYGIILEKEVNDCYAFPYFVLEKVEKPAHEFKPFDKVLVRDNDDDEWAPAFFSHISKHPDYGEEYPFVTLAHQSYKQGIPYKGNEHLVGTTDKPEE